MLRTPYLCFFTDQTRCNVWILDGDLYHKGLLKFALEAISLKDTLIMLVVDMSKPWAALDSLQKWASVVREHIDKLKIPPEEMKEMEQKSEYIHFIDARKIFIEFIFV